MCENAVYYCTSATLPGSWGWESEEASKLLWVKWFNCCKPNIYLFFLNPSWCDYCMYSVTLHVICPHFSCLDDCVFLHSLHPGHLCASPHGCMVLQIGWYNSVLPASLHLAFPDDCLAVVVLSTPSMFEQAFLPFLEKKSCQGLSDPIDQCVRHCISSAASEVRLTSCKCMVMGQTNQGNVGDRSGWYF